MTHRSHIIQKELKPEGSQNARLLNEKVEEFGSLEANPKMTEPSYATTLRTEIYSSEAYDEFPPPS